MNEEVERRAWELGWSTNQYLLNLADYPVFFGLELWHDRNLNRFGALGVDERDMMQYACAGPQLRIIMAERGIGKTYFCGALTATHRLYKRPESKVLYLSKAAPAARSTVGLVQDWIRVVPFLRHLDASNMIGKKWSETQFDVAPCPESRVPSLQGIGGDGQLPSNRADLTIGDDMETDQNVKTQEGRLELRRKMTQIFAITSWGPQEVLLLGTYQHIDSLYRELANMMDERGRKVYHLRSWPALYPTPGERKLILGLAPRIQKRLDSGEAKPGDVVFPHRTSVERIIKAKSHGKTFFNFNYMMICDAGDDTRYPLKLRDLITFNVDPNRAPIAIVWGLRNHNDQSTRIESIPCVGFEDDGLFAPINFDGAWAPYAGTLMWIDPAGTGEDKTAYCVVGWLGGMVWAKELRSFPAGGGYEDHVLAAIADRARFHKCTRVLCEKEFGDGMFGALLKPYLERAAVRPGEHPDHPNGWAVRVEGVSSGKGIKEDRIIDALEGPMVQHRVVIDRSIASNEDFQRQLTRIRREPECLAHEDELEAFAMAVKSCQRQMESDPEEEARLHREREEQEIMDLLMEDHTGNAHKPSWIVRV